MKDIPVRNRQQDIIDAAVKVFAKKGFHGSSTKEIAKEAGVAEGTIFRYFSTKKELLLKLAVPRAVDTLNETLTQYKGETPEKVLAAVLINRLELITENLDLMKLLIYESQFHPELRHEFFVTIVNPAMSTLKEYFQSEIDSGGFKAMDIDIMIKSLAGMLMMQLLFQEAFDGRDAGSTIKQLVETFLEGVTKGGRQDE